MPFFIDPNDLQNDDFRLQDEDGDLTLTHKATGATFKYDSTDGGWIPSDQFGTEANPVPNSSHFEVVSTEQGIIDNLTLTQATVGSISTHNGDQVTVSSSSFQTIFDVTDPVDVLRGHIINNGSVLSDVRVTWGDDTTDTFRLAGRSSDSGGDVYTTMPIPSIVDVQTLEFENPGGNDQEFGWAVMTV